MRHDDGHPLRPIRRPPSSPRQRAAALAAAATSERPTAVGHPEVVPGASVPRFLVPASSPESVDPVRVQAMRAPAWVELRASAWLITRESGSVVHASDLVYPLLGRTPEELEELLSDPGDPSPGYSWIRRTVIERGHAGVLLRIPLTDGTVRQVEIVSRRLPRRSGAEDRYFSVLTLHED